MDLNFSELEIKKEKIRDRLLTVPVLLYHNIDGKGPFSVTSEQLREQFLYLKKNGVKVVPLADLLNRLENPVPFDGNVVVITFDDGYKSMYSKLLPIVKEFNYPVTLFVYLDFIRNSSSTALTWDELREMDRNGIDIQSHTISHIDMTSFADYNDPEASRVIFNELFMSRKIIEKELGKKVDVLAFPYGRLNLQAVKLSGEAGYKRVVSTEYGSNLITRNNYTIHRHHIKSDFSIKSIENIVFKY
ncbi:MAG: polysaccharide deacetylase family protein [Spirochaetes bacterium]|nr:polysaccharide deacetylase family protein [Spirochaetota bacterium]